MGLLVEIVGGVVYRVWIGCGVWCFVVVAQGVCVVSAGVILCRQKVKKTKASAPVGKTWSKKTKFAIYQFVRAFSVWFHGSKETLGDIQKK